MCPFVAIYKSSKRIKAPGVGRRPGPSLVGLALKWSGSQRGKVSDTSILWPGSLFGPCSQFGWTSFCIAGTMLLVKCNVSCIRLRCKSGKSLPCRKMIPGSCCNCGDV